MREMFVSPHVLKFLRGDKSTPRHLIKKAMDTRVALERFIEGAWINVAMDPDNKSSIAELARNREVEEGVWNFRIRDPKPQIRVFGGFAERDHFIALDYRNRDDLNFDTAVSNTLRDWRELFGENGPLTGDEIGAYLSDKYRLV